MLIIFHNNPQWQKREQRYQKLKGLQRPVVSDACYMYVHVHIKL